MSKNRKMKILQLKSWQMFLILFGPCIIMVGLDILLENKDEVLSHGIMVYFLIAPTFFYHLFVGKKITELLEKEIVLSYPVTCICIILNISIQLIGLLYDDWLTQHHLIIIILGLGSYLYIILFTHLNIYRIEDKFGIKNERKALMDFIFMWTLPFGIWKFQPRLNNISNAVSSQTTP